MKPVYRARKRMAQDLWFGPAWNSWVTISRPEFVGKYYDQVQMWCPFEDRWVDISRTFGRKR